MWSTISFDLLAKIFFFLSPDALASAMVACRNWHTCAKEYPSITTTSRHHPAWFMAVPSRNRGLCCHILNPTADKWYVLSLDFLKHPIRPIATFDGLILSSPSNMTTLQLTLCNPFTKQFVHLPTLNITRTNPAIGVVVLISDRNKNYNNFPSFKVYVAGGMSQAPRGGATTYESTLEMYDSKNNTWEIIGPMPMEFAVRLTVWTPSESVYSNGVLYWITSARAYNVMGFDIRSNKWKELSVPLAEVLEFASFVSCNGKLTLIGGTCGGEASMWELRDDDNWCRIEKVPSELVTKFCKGTSKGSWNGTKCVASEGCIWLYKELCNGMIVWKESEGKWIWVNGCNFVKKENLAIKGVLLNPNLSLSNYFLGSESGNLTTPRQLCQ
ncbi:hypothetical protein ACFE04_032008 [Oxalis oulophora]